MMKKILILLLLALPALAQYNTERITGVQAETPAMIKGVVIDSETGKPLPYTNVFLSGTNIGTIAMQNGKFYLNGIRPGTYTVKASYISYGTGMQMVTVAAGEIADIEFNLDVEAIYVDTIHISGERKLIEIEQTGSVHRLTSDQMDAMPLDNIVEMIAHQPGVTLQDNEIHIRGGRADDTQFIVDGISVNDPLAGGGYGYTIDPSIINEIEVLTGGFNAEYGQAVSGIVNVSTKEGSDKIRGKMSLKRDYFLGRGLGLSQAGIATVAGAPISMALGQRADKTLEPDWHDYDNFTGPQNIDVVKASASGPDPIAKMLRAMGINLPGSNYLLLSGSMDIRDGYLPIYSRSKKLESPLYTQDWIAPRQQNDWNGMAKWTWNINTRHKLNFTASRQVAVSQGFRLPGEGFPRPFMDNLDNYMVFTNENILNQLFYRVVRGDNSFFEFSVGRNFNRMHANVLGNDDYTTYGLINAYPSPDGQALGGADRWHDHFSESWNLKSSYSWVANSTNKFKTGFEMSFTEMQLVDLQSSLGSPPPGKLGIKEDIFRVHPRVGAAYFQDTIDYRGMILNAGFRVDGWAPGREVENVMENHDQYLFIYSDMVDQFNDDTVNVAGTQWKLRISPRLGMSFPVTEKDKFFFNYGHFSQWPRYAYVYPQLQAQSATEIQLLGNPNLDPKVTVEYETGMQHEFPGLWSLGLTFFNRDIYGYAKSVTMAPVDIGADETPDPNDTGTTTINPVRYFNGDSARSLGVEMSVIKRTTKWLSGSTTLELSRATGTNSNADEAYLLAVYDEAYSPTASIGGLARTPLLWDKPWKISLNADFSVFEKDRPVLFDWTLPPNWSVNLLFRAEAGQRYTSRAFKDPDDPVVGEYIYGDFNAEVGPTKSTLNIRFNKYWNLPDKQKVTFYIEGRNVLDHKNYRRINSWTGDGYQVGDFNPQWEEKWGNWYGEGAPEITTESQEYAKSTVNPSYIEDPRMILMGVSWSW